MKNATPATVLADFPAYDIVAPARDADGDIVLAYGDHFRCPEYDWSEFSAFTLRGCYELNGEKDGYTYAEAVALADKFGHDHHAISRCAVCLSDSYGAKERFIAVSLDDTIKLDGVRFSLARAWNQNIKLVAI